MPQPVRQLSPVAVVVAAAAAAAAAAVNAQKEEVSRQCARSCQADTERTRSGYATCDHQQAYAACVCAASVRCVVTAAASSPGIALVMGVVLQVPCSVSVAPLFRATVVVHDAGQSAQVPGAVPVLEQVAPGAHEHG
jgi:hypothetical protein